MQLAINLEYMHSSYVANSGMGGQGLEPSDLCTMEEGKTPHPHHSVEHPAKLFT